MNPSLFQLLPVIAAALFIAFVVLIAAETRSVPTPWQFPALVAVIFAAWTAFAVIAEGPLGFWNEHRLGAWSNQIWFDLLLAATISWTFVLPRARAVGMRAWPWLALVIGTGSIGLTAMLARCLYLEQARRPVRSIERKGV